MKKLTTLLVAGAATMAFGAALAHGPAPAKHGGIVASASELGFELASQGDKATLYVEDHGKPMATAGITGKLTVLNGSDKSEAELVPVGDNRLEANGVKLASGAKAVATLTLANKKPVTVRFSVK